MRKNIDLSAEEYSEIVDSFYTYFENGYKFEEFLKVYLEKIGLEEVFVTKKSGDGGIDLTAVRKGIGGLSNSVLHTGKAIFSRDYSISRENPCIKGLFQKRRWDVHHYRKSV